jgi:predicted ABC-type ATPase
MNPGSRRVVILGGCNGAGKTTSSRALLADTLGVLTFVNADQIAQGLAGFDVAGVAIQAMRVMLARLRELADQGASFAFESTLSGQTTTAFLEELRKQGYRVEMHYFWLDDVELSIQRVAARVAAGGHDVLETTLRHRYLRSIRNFWTLYRPLADNWNLYDNSTLGDTIRVASGAGVQTPDVWDSGRWPIFERPCGT